ncbi:DUF3825 domain-containing protein [Atopobium fossor]|uniref:DUF3825 domain-containing protein n=1 Tax=Atopobium fossor TaxID=39487 RepID=UPI000424DFD5|nr:DUF3825 domain-containing protein [Atopobium fossor]
MTMIPINNALYLYKLLKQELGYGRQIPLSDVEAVLLADDITPADLDCTDIGALMEALPEFVKLTVFKKGRIFATIMPHADFDQALEKIDEPTTADKAATKGKPWKRKRSSKLLRPQKPQHKEAPAPIRTESKSETEQEPEPIPVQDSEPEFEIAPKVIDEPTSKSTSEVAPIREAEALDEAVSETEPETKPEPDYSWHDYPIPMPEAIPTPNISLNITYAPQTPLEEPSVPAQTFAAPSQVEAYIPVVLQSTLPQDFINEVLCPNNLLKKIYELAPINTNALELLRSSWNTARTTGSLFGTRSSISFALINCNQTTATIQRSKMPGHVKPWEVVSVVQSNQPILGKTPQTYCASDELLITRVTARPQTSALNELATFALMGSWENIAATLKDFAPTTTFLPTELCSYISAVFYRAKQSGTLIQASTGDFIACNTGLLTPFNQVIYLCFTPSAKKSSAKITPWQFAGFATTQTPGLGEKLTNLPQLPPAPNFELHANVLSITPEATLQLPTKQIADMLPDSILNTLPKQDFIDACNKSLITAQYNYRTATPVYSTQLNQTLVALPVDATGLENYALILKPSENTYELANVVSRIVARGAAQVISLELPSWLV